MLSFPNAKINLGLKIISKRPDGYHNIESCFYPIPWCDSLELIESASLKFTTSGLEIPGDEESNLCLKAYRILKQPFELPPVHIHLHKAIPMGAGLGGGSADGAFMLKMLNEKFNLGLSVEELQAYAQKLGSDCPFFIDNKPVIAMGTGNVFHNIKLDMKGYYIALKNPGIHIGTKEAYAGVTPKAASRSIQDIIEAPITDWKTNLHNDFEDSVLPNHPEIATLKDTFYEAGAFYASMTGSGSTVYGLFQDEPKFNEQFQVYKLR